MSTAAPEPTSLDQAATILLEALGGPLRWRGLPAQQLAEALEAAVLDYIGEAGRDDLPVLVLRVPAGAPAVPDGDAVVTVEGATAAG